MDRRGAGEIGRRRARAAAAAALAVICHLLAVAFLAATLRPYILKTAPVGGTVFFSLVTGPGASPRPAETTAPEATAQTAPPIAAPADPAPPVAPPPPSAASPLEVAAAPPPTAADPVVTAVTALLALPTTPAAPRSSVQPTQDSAPPGGSAGVCNISAAVDAALKADPSVHDAIARIPRSARSVANAVMIWDGTWTDFGLLGGTLTLEPIRNVVLRELAAAPPSCRNDPVTGPRLVVVGDAARTTILTFGSGVWRWSDLAPKAHM